MKKLRILVDMDNIIVDMTPKWLDRYNKDHNDNVTVHDLTNWHIQKHVKIGTRIHDYLYEPGFFLDVPPIAGSLDVLKQLQDDGHHVVIVSSPSWPGTSASDKITWCRQHMPWLNKRDIFLGHHKFMVKGDVFIDDSPDNIKSYRAHWPDAMIMAIAYPFNDEVKQLCNVYAWDYKNTVAAWNTMHERIDIHAGKE